MYRGKLLSDGYRRADSGISNGDTEDEYTPDRFPSSSMTYL